MALLTYRATPLPWCGLSPAELLMGRRLRTPVPQTNEQLIPKWSYLPEFRQKNREFKERQKKDFDRCHRVQELPDLSDDTNIWVKSEGEPVQGRVVTTATRPRSYIVEVPSGQIERNRRHLSVIPKGCGASGTSETANETPNSSQQPTSRIMTRSQTGTPIFPPERLA